MRTPRRIKLKERIICIIAEAEYYSGFNRKRAFALTVNGIVKLVQNNYRRRRK